MTQNNRTYSELSSYWKSENTLCLRFAIPKELIGTEMADIYENVGMPSQDWWWFNFTVPSIDSIGACYGTICKDCKLYYRIDNNACFMADRNNNIHFANVNFLSFVRTLVLFDMGCKRIQRECGGDSGEDWDKSDEVIKQMEKAMREVDIRAFESIDNFWPCLLVDIRG